MMWIIRITVPYSLLHIPLLTKNNYDCTPLLISTHHKIYQENVIGASQFIKNSPLRILIDCNKNSRPRNERSEDFLILPSIRLWLFECLQTRSFQLAIYKPYQQTIAVSRFPSENWLIYHHHHCSRSVKIKHIESRVKCKRVKGGDSLICKLY